jgi:hypothetical protein
LGTRSGEPPTTHPPALVFLLFLGPSHAPSPPPLPNPNELTSPPSYEVQDPEPDETGAPGQVYKTSAAALIAIPSVDAILPDYPVGKTVLARYPETTTFYRAEVTGVKKDVYRLKFEDDQNKEMEVDRRFVLDMSNK